jgi:hypothetical protein
MTKAANCGILFLALAVSGVGLATKAPDLYANPDVVRRGNAIQVQSVMSDVGQLVWIARPPSLKDRTIVYFTYSPSLGLSDVDFHQINDQNWAAMQSPSDDAIAQVEVPPQTSAAQLKQTIALIAKKGGYQWIAITVGH